jgi:D-xylose 1-dehydrogenase (NADP+, D-xylono-1,5-lactone-forming)
MTVRWGMLSTAAIGRVVAGAIRGSPQAELVAIASRDERRAADYAAVLGVPRSYGSYEALLADENVDAVYNALPIALHTEWTIRALQSGKHVLCEKPFAMTAADAAACFDAAGAADRVCVEGLMWRHHPQTKLAQQFLADGAIGRLAYIRCALTVDVPPGDIRRTGKLGGGALLDLGCYCVSAIRLFGGQPLRVAAERVVDRAEGAEGGDLRLAATLALAGDALGQFDVALDLPRRDELELVGTAGKIVISDPWLCRTGFIEVERDGIAERLPADPSGAYGLSAGSATDDAYRIEFTAANHAIVTGTPPAFGRADAVGQAEVIEAVRRAAAGGTLVDLSVPTAALPSIT